MATLLEDRNRYGVRRAPVPAQGFGIPPGGAVMGVRPPINMGMADVVQPRGLPAPPGALPAPAAAGQIAPTSQSLAARAPGMLGRFAPGAGAALGVGLEAQQVVDVARNPNSTGLDVAAQAAQGAGRLGAAGAGAVGGATLGAMAGPLAPVAVPLGAIAGGALGYFGADQAIAGGRAIAEGAAAPSPAAAGGAPPESGGAAFGVFPQMPGPRAPILATQSQVRAVDNQLPSAALAGTPLPPPPVVQAAPGPLGGGPLADPNANVGVVGAEGVTAADRLAQINRDAEASRSLSDRAMERSRQGWDGPTPGMAVIGPRDYANRNQEFNAAADLRTAQAKGDALAVRSISAGIAGRQDAATETNRQAAETQRAQLQEQGLASRAQVADAQQTRSSDIAERRVDLEAARLGQGNIPAGYERAPGGGLQFIKGGPADPSTPKGKGALTEGQSKSLLFGTRMQSANKTLEDLEKGGKLFSTLGANTGYGVGAVANVFNSEQGQKLDQAKRDFLNAVLRKESGAVIADSEFASGDKQYFPQIGDSPGVIAQKKANRELATRGVLAEVPDAEARTTQVAGPAQQPTASSLPSGMSRQVGTSGGKPVYEDAQGRRFVGG